MMGQVHRWKHGSRPLHSACRPSHILLSPRALRTMYGLCFSIKPSLMQLLACVRHHMNMGQRCSLGFKEAH